LEKGQTSLKREIGVLGLSLNIVNIIVGAGIFVLPAIVAKGLGAASILAYLFCGLLIAIIMLCFAEVGSKITKSGGPYAYIEAAFGKYFGFITAIFFVCATITADAAIANALLDILGILFPLFKIQWVKTVFLLTLFTSLAYINIIGVKQGIGLVKLITFAKIIPLLLLILIGSTEISMANLTWDIYPSIRNIGEVSLILFFAFQGGEAGLAVSGEVKNPQKTIPRAIFVGISGVLLLYVLIQTVSQGVLGSELANFQEAPLAEVASHLIGPIGFSLIMFGAAVSMFGGISGDVLSIPRVIFAASKDDVIPIKLLSLVHKKYATPAIAIIIYATLDFLIATFGGFEQLAIISSASSLLIYFGIALAVIKLRRTKRESTHSFKIPGGYMVPIVAIIIIIWFLSNLKLNEQIGALVFIVSLSLIYLLIVFFRRKNAQKSK